MEINNKVFCNQWPIVLKFVQSYTYYKVLYQHCKDNKLESAFWAKAIDSLLEMAAIEWCKIFGSHGNSNQLHWKKTTDDLSDDDIQAFQQMIYDHTDFSKSEWEEYNLQMRTFRDQYVAHLDVSESLPTPPFFIHALQVAYAYDKWIRDLLLRDNIPGIMESPSLEEYAAGFDKEALVVCEVIK